VQVRLAEETLAAIYVAQRHRARPLRQRPVRKIAVLICINYGGARKNCLYRYAKNMHNVLRGGRRADKQLRPVHVVSTIY
jgi:hypothetical protein